MLQLYTQNPRYLQFRTRTFSGIYREISGSFGIQEMYTFGRWVRQVSGMCCISPKARRRPRFCWAFPPEHTA
ncbi:MAG: hypothetical protein KatS3mg023_0074 [Armatimonadota bacterium]|nr:MAG: hypothetical protein KatS3mg023_0074 [Armatimonadota bacterium]